MKLSEAIALGRNTTKLDSSKWLTKNQDCGCLLGIGFTETPSAEKYAHREFVGTGELIYEWPWITELRQMPDSLLPQFTNYGLCSVIDIISQLAASVERKNITFDQAIDWIRENEPQETLEEKREIVEAFCESLVNGR